MKLKIVGKTYTVDYVDPDMLDSGCTYGLCLPDKQKILIAKDLAPEKSREVLLHEILHAVWDGMDIGFSETTEEKVVSAEGKGLAAFIFDNPKEVLDEIFK